MKKKEALLGLSEWQSESGFCETEWMSDFCETVSECALVLSVLDLDYGL